MIAASLGGPGTVCAGAQQRDAGSDAGFDTLMADDQEILWLGVRTVVPEDWQIVRHGLGLARGKLMLVDRYRQRLQLNWTQVKETPDLERMVDDYRSTLLEHQPEADVIELEGLPHWVGARRDFPVSGQAITRAVTYDAGTRRMLEAVVLTDPKDPADEGLLQRVLDMTDVVEPADAVTRWRAFDIDLSLPPDWRLIKTMVKPADVTWTFRQMRMEGAKQKLTGGEMTIHRMGMADAWWHGDGARFLTASAKKVRFEVDVVLRGSRQVTRAQGVEQGPRAKRWLGMLRHREDWLWHDEEENAVYTLSILSPRGQRLDPEIFEVGRTPA